MLDLDAGSNEMVSDVLVAAVMGPICGVSSRRSARTFMLSPILGLLRRCVIFVWVESPSQVRNDME